MMKNILVLWLLLNIGFPAARGQENDNPKYVLAIHGGAGTILKKNMSDSLEKAYQAVLSESLRVGYRILKGGGSSIDAVSAAIQVMEDSPLFNAGKGAVFNHQGQNELDASIMDGSTLRAGAVAGVHTVKNPITAARAVMERSEHVLMIGAGAEEFSAAHGVTIVDPSYFWTQPRWDALQRIRQRDAEKTELDHQALQIREKKYVDEKFGTVGCVALDQNGNLAAGTSTGGMTNKKYGRVGDAPIIGAGTYANDQVAVSCTGWGEYYIRTVAAYDVAAQLKYGASTAAEAAAQVIKKIGDLGGNGGMIVLDRHGGVTMPFNTEGMYRGAITEDGHIDIRIYKD
ncbi:beta-aspartyl-peptidase (threonine type) [Sphingobacterium allocomposti]|uniref:Isoaspartyl peptidase n=1 Tax=Sphingobacterium allocomposti TaxID=415956 RepID=A0A5S5DT54_9SPHI|nr:isoaspartyl peptidase/L-asparaginase [Sphingobacterium composti Yoo et al. 2007 non Ten et al. 2007]TYP98558.1 beta-aspartyl-peptidase (threonine type) [Sphingobacterium composti Yoo et al. 2007 non Ten et al. 2007]